MTPAHCRVARALIDLEQAELAGLAIVSRALVADFEAGAVIPRPADLKALKRALEHLGVEFTNGGQPGVRLKARNPGGTIPAEELNASNDE
jgi:transcriptional regulator with XRE-family HTH domain